MTIQQKQVIIELDKDGFVTGVYCPGQDFVVNILDRARQAELSNVDNSLSRYYRSLEEELENLTNSY